MTYYLIIKSGSEQGDIEREVEATSLEQAIQKFTYYLPGLDDNLIAENINCDKCINTSKKDCKHN